MRLRPPPGPRQLLIRAANGETTPIGITIHVARRRTSRRRRSCTSPEYAADASRRRSTPSDRQRHSSSSTRGPTTRTSSCTGASSSRASAPAARSAHRENARPSTTSASPSPAPSSTGGTSSNARRDWNAKLARLPKPPAIQRRPGRCRHHRRPEDDQPQFGDRPQRRDRRLRHHPRPGRRRRRHPGQRLRAQAARSPTTSSSPTAASGAARSRSGCPPLNIPAGQLLNADRLDNQNDDVRIALQPHPRQRRAPNGRRASRSTTAPSATSSSDNDICANYSNEYGGGISHFGLSGGAGAAGAPRPHPRQPHLRQRRVRLGRRHHDRRRVSARARAAARGSGRVDVERNFISLNLSNDDGGGIMLLDTLGSASTPVSRHRHRVEHDREQRRHRHRRRHRRSTTPTNVRDHQQHLRRATPRPTRPRTATALPNGAGFVSEPHTLGRRLLDPGRVLQQHLLAQRGLHVRPDGRGPARRPPV